MHSLPMTKEVKVLIVDDHPLLRRGVCDVIGHDSRFRVMGEASDGEEALRLLDELKPQIAILDIDMPRLNGLEVIRAIRQLPLDVKVIILTMYKEEDMFNAVMDLGAKD